MRATMKAVLRTDHIAALATAEYGALCELRSPRMRLFLHLSARRTIL